MPSSSKRLSLSLPLIAVGIPLTCLGAQNAGQPTKFDGQSIPDPPAQKEPWTPPPTKLPRFLLKATSALFEQGVADPRGCEFRMVELRDGRIYKTPVFVLPEKQGDTRRFAVGLDGEVYPVVSVGPAADLDAQIRGIAASLRRGPPNIAGIPGGHAHLLAFQGVFGRHGRIGRDDPASTRDSSVLKVCLLLRLGRADLTESLFAPATAEEGWVWQAEEVRRGGRWERYYGFVGRHVIAAVPAGSIDLPGGLPPVPGAR